MASTELSKKAQEVAEKIAKGEALHVELYPNGYTFTDKLKRIFKLKAERVSKVHQEVSSFIVISEEGTQTYSKNVFVLLKPFILLKRLAKNILHFYHRGSVPQPIFVVPLYKGLLNFATGKRTKPKRKGLGSDQNDYNRAIVNRLDNLKEQIEQTQGEKSKSTLMKVLENAAKKNSDN